MIQKLSCAAIAAVVIGGSLTAQAQVTFMETFTGGTNEGAWTFGTGNQVIETSGGNPGAYLHDPFIDTFAPQPRTGFNISSQFLGDYRTQQVTSIGIDLITFAVDFSAAERPLTVMLVSDNNTASTNDDWAAYRIGPNNVPLPGEGWKSYAFDVPSQSMTLPVGWATIGFGPNSPANPNWNQVITDVDQLRYFYGDPTFFFIFQGWNLGLDNPSITTVPEPTALAVLALSGVSLFRPRRWVCT